MALLRGLNPTGRKGVFFKDHETRKYGARRDRLFILRYTITGKTRTEVFGWASEGFTELDAEKKIGEFKANAKNGAGASSLEEERHAREADRQQQLEAEHREQAESEAKEIEEQRRQTTVADFFEKVYLPQAKHDKKPDTWGTEDRLFLHWVSPVIGQLAFPDISIEHLNEIKRNMTEGKRGAAAEHPRDKKKPKEGEASAQERRNPPRSLSPKSQQYALAVVRQLWNLACAVKPALATGPWPGATPQFKKPRTANERRRFLSRKEAAILLDRLAKSSKDVHDMALLALHCGMRSGEILRLTWRRVNLAKAELLLVDTKNGESRTAYLTDQALDMLRKRFANHKPGQHVFVHMPSKKDGQEKPFPAIPLTYSRIVKELGLNEGVTDPRDKVVFHTLRHTYASWLVEQGANIRLVGDLLGHKTLIMTTRYAHVSADAQRQAVAALSKSLTPAGENVIQLADRKKEGAT
jgi:integrase